SRTAGEKDRALPSFHHPRQHLLSAVEGTDGGNSDGILKSVEMDVLEGGGIGREGLVISIIDKNLNESEGMNSFECIPHAFGIGAVHAYRKHLCFLFPRYFFRHSRQSTCKYTHVYIHISIYIITILFIHTYIHIQMI
ncbi:hypothetical protein V8G54_015044, partial [Vigna mungo]